MCDVGWVMCDRRLFLTCHIPDLISHIDYIPTFLSLASNLYPPTSSLLAVVCPLSSDSMLYAPRPMLALDWAPPRLSMNHLQGVLPGRGPY